MIGFVVGLAGRLTGGIQRVGLAMDLIAQLAASGHQLE
jgi:hypothetical protein